MRWGGLRAAPFRFLHLVICSSSALLSACLTRQQLMGYTPEFVRGSPGPASTPEITAVALADWVLESKSDVIEAYQFAAVNPEILKKIPCYCGCADSGHKSNYDCYVKEVRADGSLVFDRHGSY